jgi:pSer/pThr/pTyr-binding forkhead associated (FHA) protein
MVCKEEGKAMDFLDTINKGVGIASKMVTKGVGEVSKTLKPTKETAKIILQTGMFYRRNESPVFGKFVPTLEVFEPQFTNKMNLGFLKNVTLPAAERAFVAGTQALLLGKDREAIEKFQEAVAKDPQLTDGYYMLGCLYLVRGDYRQSLENYKKAILLQQTLSKVLRRYLNSFKMNLTITRNSCLTLFADLIGINTLLALAMRAEGIKQDAMEVLDQMLGVMPSQPVLLFFISCLLYEMGGFERVVECLKNTVPDSNQGYLNLLILGRSLLSLGDMETAREVMKKGLNKDDMDPEILMDFRYSIALCDATGWTSGRNDDLEKLLGAKPDYQDIFDRLGLKMDTSFREHLAATAAKTAAASQAPPSTPPQAPSQISQAPQVAKSQAPAAAPTPQLPPQSVTERTVEQPSSAQQRVPQPSEAPAQPAKLATPAGPAKLTSLDGKIDVLLDRDIFVIGRENGDIVLDWDASASKSHARIIKEGNVFFVEDLNSTNGTWVNQYRIPKKVNLNRGDQIKIGNTIFRFS